MKSKLYIVAILLLGTLFSCTDKIESLEDLKNADFEQNPEIALGFRLGVQPDSIGLLFYKYGFEREYYTPIFCEKCNTWRKELTISNEDPHSYQYILRKEDVYGNIQFNNPEIIKTNNPNVFYTDKGNGYVRVIKTDKLVYFDDNGNYFEEVEPFISFSKYKDKLYINKFKNIDKGVVAYCDFIGDFGKDTIITEFTLKFESFNNPPISRLVYNGNSVYYKDGQIVNINDKNFKQLYENCNETFMTALNQKEVNQVIKYFELKFGARKYDSKNYSGDFKRKENSTFYRSYRWAKGSVNISLVIDDYPPENLLGVDKNNPYIKQKGYRVTASYKFNDEVLKIIEKENLNGKK
jgi:hypothetical protein